jgi:hypothetical protein
MVKIMHYIRRTPVLLTLCFGIFLLQGCAGLNQDSISQVQRDQKLLPASADVKHMAEQALEHQYPDRFNALHRARLSIGGDTHVMKGFLSIDRQKRQIKMICQGEMGGTLFEVHLTDEKINVVSVSKVFKKKWIERFVAADIKRIYLAPALEIAMCFSGTDGHVVLKEQRGKQVQTYTFDADPKTGLRPVGFIISENNRSTYFMDLTYGREGYPDFITIDNRAGYYKLDISVRMQ